METDAAAVRTRLVVPSISGDCIPSKEDNLDYCMHNLISYDLTMISDTKELTALIRDNVQLTINKIFSLPTERSVDGDTLAILATQARICLPRMQLVPSDAPMTRWEKFAKEKNIVKRRRHRMKWDENKKDWAPRWGFKSVASNAMASDPVIELKPGQNPNDDHFEERSKRRQIAKAKQKIREYRNQIERDNKNPAEIYVPNLEKDVKNRKTSKGYLQRSLNRAQKSTASFGKRDAAARGEKKKTAKPNQKAPVKSLKAERDDYMKVLQRVGTKS